MLLRVGSDVASKLWDYIYSCVRVPLIEVDDELDRSNKLLEGVLKGDVQCWFLVDGKVLKVVGLTVITYEKFDNRRELMIYSLFGFEPVSDELWADAIKSLAIFAKTQLCKAVVAYTNQKRIVDIVKGNGGDASLTFIRMEV